MKLRGCCLDLFSPWYIFLPKISCLALELILVWENCFQPKHLPFCAPNSLFRCFATLRTNPNLQHVCASVKTFGWTHWSQWRCPCLACTVLLSEMKKKKKKKSQNCSYVWMFGCLLCYVFFFFKLFCLIQIVKKTKMFWTNLSRAGGR